jgi:GTPase SAR1 family protein
MSLIPNEIDQYHVFLASPSDVGLERQYVRRFFDEYNRHTARIWHARFDVVDWENYATIGVGRPQELITQQTLESHRKSLALVIGIMAQRFGSPTGKAESGTEEEFNWAMDSHKATGFPEIKWFFRKVGTLELPSDPDEAEAALAQWKKVRAFRQRMQDLSDPVFYAEYPDANRFSEVLARDLNQWLTDPARPWVAKMAANNVTTGSPAAVALPIEFDAERYRAAVLNRFDKLNYEMLDTTGAFYNGVRLWSIFVPQSVRECHKYNPRLLEIPKEHQRRLLDAGAITAKELEEAERQADQQRQEYFSQPLRPALDVVDEALRGSPAVGGRKLVILGDPGSGKSSLVRYLALRWASIAEPVVRDTQPIPLVIDLGTYGRWQCKGRKDFVRFLEEAPVWHEWPCGLLARLLEQPGRVVILLDGLDEVFDAQARESVINDIQRFSSQYANVPVILTSRVVGYQAQRLRDADFKHFMLQDLDTTQITDFISRWHEVTFDDPAQAMPKRERLQKAIRDSKSIAMLAGNPLLLTMMAILNRNQELPRYREDLYAQASRVLLHQWDTERALENFPGMSAEIGLREKNDILRRIAAHMQAGPGGLKGNLIDGPTLAELIEDYLHNELHFPQARAAARAVVEQLRQRNFILCFVGADSYAFVHRTFLEYFCAADFVHRFNIAKTLDVDGLVQLFDEHCRDDEWREVLRLICGQIDEPFVGRIVERLATRTDLEKWDGRTPLPELPLAIGCLNEARSTGRLEVAGSMLIKTVVHCFLMGRRPPEAFVLDMVAAGREIGVKWPGKSVFSFSGQHPKSTPYYHHWRWPAFLASVFEQRSWIETLAYCESWDVRRGSLEVLAERWPDPASRELLTRRAIEDDSGDVRSAALRALAGRWPDSASRDLLTRHAIEENKAYVRSAALRALVEQWPDPASRDLLTRRAVEDSEGGVRSTALQALAGQWPDTNSRELLTRCAVEDDKRDARSAALLSLAEQWPDSDSRELLSRRAVADGDGLVRSAALRVLAEQWSDPDSRKLLTHHAIKDDLEYVRSGALRVLAEQWPDPDSRGLLTRRAVEDSEGGVRSAALRVLAEQWPDPDSRKLLTYHAVKDDLEYVRSGALRVLAEQWPDPDSRDLLTQRAVEDSEGSVRSAALRALAEQWPDSDSRELLSRRAVVDGEEDVRSAALRALAEQWPDPDSRDLLTQRVIEDVDGDVRSSALQALAEQWPDQASRDLLARYAVEDDDGDVRSAALRALAEQWPDQASRDLLTLRAIEDDDGDVRSSALEMLAEQWPDQASHDLLTRRALEAPEREDRGAAFFALGMMHTTFARFLLTRDLDGFSPYLDPHEPISREQIEKAAAKAGVRPEDTDAQVASLSEYLGWDITVGAGKR